MTEHVSQPPPSEILTTSHAYQELCDILAREGEHIDNAFYATRHDLTLTNVSDYFGQEDDPTIVSGDSSVIEKYKSILELRSRFTDWPYCWIVKPNTVPEGPVIRYALMGLEVDFDSDEPVIVLVRDQILSLAVELEDAPEIATFIRNDPPARLTRRGSA